MAKVQISIKDELLQRVDQEAKDNCVGRSAMLAMMISTYFRSMDTLSTADKLIEALNKYGSVEQ